MFEFLKRWFQPSPSSSRPIAPQAAPAPTAPGTHIHYDPELVSHLIEDHRRLEDLFGGIVQASGERDEGRLVTLLNAFGNTMRDHLLKENVRFYVYVQHTGDAEQTALVHGFQREMREIGKVLTSFLFRHTKQEIWNEDAWSHFARELDEIAQVLTRRIATEENTLYPLYQPPK